MRKKTEKNETPGKKAEKKPRKTKTVSATIYGRRVEEWSDYVTVQVPANWDESRIREEVFKYCEDQEVDAHDEITDVAEEVDGVTIDGPDDSPPDIILPE